MGFTLKPAEGMNFIDREELLNEILSELKNMQSTTGFAIYGSRRVGKTSLLKEVQRRLSGERNIAVVYFSVWDLVEFTLEEFCRRLSTEVINTYRSELGIKFKAAELLRTPLSVLRKISELRVVYEDIEFLVSFRGADTNELVERTLNLPEKLAEETGTKCVLLIDEFPSVIDLKAGEARVGEGIIRKIRTLSEGWHRTVLCISGSIRSTMALVVLSSASPFYRQFVVREIGPLEEEHLVHFLRRNLRIDGEAAREICRFSGGIPFYVQFMGKMLERKRGRIRVGDVARVEEEFLTEEGNLLFTEEFERLSARERLVLMALAQGRCSPSSIAEEVGDRVSNVNVFLKYLEDKGYVHKRGRGRYHIEDPVFEEWLRRRFA
ncbi:AAA family ATPase [Candidatus Pyrohabitans sp.]